MYAQLSPLSANDDAFALLQQPQVDPLTEICAVVQRNVEFSNELALKLKKASADFTEEDPKKHKKSRNFARELESLAKNFEGVANLTQRLLEQVQANDKRRSPAANVQNLGIKLGQLAACTDALCMSLKTVMNDELEAELNNSRLSLKQMFDGFIRRSQVYTASLRQCNSNYAISTGVPQEPGELLQYFRNLVSAQMQFAASASKLSRGLEKISFSEKSALAADIVRSAVKAVSDAAALGFGSGGEASAPANGRPE